MDLSNSITYNITKTGNVLRQLTSKRINNSNINLTPEESVLMNQLWDKDNQKISELNLWSVKEASTLTRQIDGLVKKGFVVRTRGTEDRRTVYVKLSTEGKKLKKVFSNSQVSNLDDDLIEISELEAKKILNLLIAIRQKAQVEIQKP